MTTDPHAMDLPADEPTPWPGWTGLRRGPDHTTRNGQDRDASDR